MLDEIVDMHTDFTVFMASVAADLAAALVLVFWVAVFVSLLSMAGYAALQLAKAINKRYRMYIWARPRQGKGG